MSNNDSLVTTISDHNLIWLQVGKNTIVLKVVMLFKIIQMLLKASGQYSPDYCVPTF